MRRIARLDRSIDVLRVRATNPAQNSYLCRSCKQRASAFSTTTLRAASSSKGPGFTEKLRRKIWGTDKPPGLENPYGEVSAFEQTKVQDRQRREADREAARSQSLAGYEPADTWDGLEQVGDVKSEWEAIWDSEHPFVGFNPPYIMNDPSEITANLRRAVVEVFTLRQGGQSFEISTAEPGEDLTRNIQISFTEQGPVLDFGSQEAFETIVQSLAPRAEESVENDLPTESEEDVTADRSTEDPLRPEVADETAVKENPTESEEDVAADRSILDPLTKTDATTYEELVASWNPAWLQTSLEDPEVKFAVLKRTLQLTGIRVSDSLINSTVTVQGLLSHLITPPKPRKLVDRLASREELMTLPNVSVFAKRITPIDKEKSLGRWKLIEKELKERGLPITGP